MQPPNSKSKRVCRGPIEPVRVIDEEQERPLLRGRAEQGEGRCPDGETRRPFGLRYPKCRRQRLCLRSLEPVDFTQDRAANLEQPRKRKLSLRLHAPRTQNAKTRSARCRVVQECRLPDPRLPDQHQRAAQPVARAGDERVNPVLLIPPGYQRHPLSLREARVRHNTGDLPGANQTPTNGVCDYLQRKGWIDEEPLNGRASRTDGCARGRSLCLSLDHVVQ